jgi:GT2 family glycosyltransferase
LIIVDDGSVKETADALDDLGRTDKRIRVVHHPENRGIPAAKNSGLNAARCPLVLFGEDDLELTPGYLATLLEHRATTGADIISGRNVWRFEHESADEALARAPTARATAVDRTRMAVDQSAELLDDTEQPLVAATMLAPLSLFKRVGFDERYRANGWREESDFQLRAIAAGARIVSCPHAVSYNYMLRDDRGGAHAISGFRRVFWMTRNNALFLRENADVIEREFRIGNPLWYSVRFALGAAWREIVFPRLVVTVRKARPLIGRRNPGERA